MEHLLTPVVTRLLQRFIKSAAGERASDLRVSLSGGSLVLANLELNLESLLGRLPLQVERAYARQLRITVPWTALATQPIQVVLDTVTVVLALDADSTGPPADGDGGSATGQALEGQEGSAAEDPGLLPGGWMGSLTALLLRTLFDTTLALNNVVVKLAAPAAVATLTCQSLSVSTCRDAWRQALERPECWLKKALAVKHASVSLDEEELAAPAAPAPRSSSFQPPLLRMPSIEATALVPVFAVLDPDLGGAGARGKRPGSQFQCAVSIAVRRVDAALSARQLACLGALAHGVTGALGQAVGTGTEPELPVDPAHVAPDSGSGSDGISAGAAAAVAAAAAEAPTPVARADMIVAVDVVLEGGCLECYKDDALAPARPAAVGWLSGGVSLGLSLLGVRLAALADAGPETEAVALAAERVSAHLGPTRAPARACSLAAALWALPRRPPTHALRVSVLGVRLGVALRWRSNSHEVGAAAADDSAAALAAAGAREVAGPLELQAMLVESVSGALDDRHLQALAALEAAAGAGSALPPQPAYPPASLPPPAALQLAVDVACISGQVSAETAGAAAASLASPDGLDGAARKPDQAHAGLAAWVLGVSLECELRSQWDANTVRDAHGLPLGPPRMSSHVKLAAASATLCTQAPLMAGDAPVLRCLARVARGASHTGGPLAPNALSCTLRLQRGGSSRPSADGAVEVGLLAAHVTPQAVALATALGAASATPAAAASPGRFRPSRPSPEASLALRVRAIVRRMRVALLPAVPEAANDDCEADDRCSSGGGGAPAACAVVEASDAALLVSEAPEAAVRPWFEGWAQPAMQADASVVSAGVSLHGPGLPAWGSPLLQPCDLRALLTAVGPPSGGRPVLALSLHAPLLALQASPAMLAAAQLLAAAYAGAPPPPLPRSAAAEALPCGANALAEDDLRSGLFSLSANPGGRPGPLEVNRGDPGPGLLGWASTDSHWVVWRFPHARCVAALLIAAPPALFQGCGFELMYQDARAGGFVAVPVRLEAWGGRGGAGDSAAGCLLIVPSASMEAEEWQLEWEAPGSSDRAAAHLDTAFVLPRLHINPKTLPGGPALPAAPPPLPVPLTVGVAAGELRASLLLDSAAGALEAAVLRLHGLQAAAHVWPAAAALRVTGVLSLAAGDASCLCTQPLLESCSIAFDLERRTLRPDDCAAARVAGEHVAGAAAALPLAASGRVPKGTAAPDLAATEGALMLPRPPPQRDGVRVLGRAGGGPLTLRLSELGLTELQRMAALADATPDTIADAPIVVENGCPEALEFGQVGTEEAILLQPGAHVPYHWRAHPALLPGACRRLRLRSVNGNGKRGMHSGGASKAPPAEPAHAHGPAVNRWSEGFEAVAHSACRVAMAWRDGLSAHVAVAVTKAHLQWRVALRPGVRVSNGTGAPLLAPAQRGIGASECSLMAYAHRPSAAAAVQHSTLRVWLDGGDGWSLPVPLHGDAPPQVMRACGLGSDVPAMRPAARRPCRGAVVCVPCDSAHSKGTAGWSTGRATGQLELRLMPPLVLTNGLPCRLAWRLDGLAALNGDEAGNSVEQGGELQPGTDVAVDVGAHGGKGLALRIAGDAAQHQGTLPAAGERCGFELAGAGGRMLSCVLAAEPWAPGVPVTRLRVLPHALLVLRVPVGAGNVRGFTAYLSLHTGDTAAAQVSAEECGGEVGAAVMVTYRLLALPGRAHLVLFRDRQPPLVLHNGTLRALQVGMFLPDYRAQRGVRYAAEPACVFFLAPSTGSAGFDSTGSTGFGAGSASNPGGRIPGSVAEGADSSGGGAVARPPLELQLAVEALQVSLWDDERRRLAGPAPAGPSTGSRSPAPQPQELCCVVLDGLRVSAVLADAENDGGDVPVRVCALRAGAAALQADMFLEGGRCPVACASEPPSRLARARERAPESPLLLDLEVRSDRGPGEMPIQAASPGTREVAAAATAAIAAEAVEAAAVRLWVDALELAALQLLLDVHVSGGSAVLPLALDTSRAPLTLPRLAAERLLARPGAAARAAAAAAAAEALLAAPALLGSLELLGNLTGLVAGLAAGAADLLGLPLAGLAARSPSQFVAGLGLGSASVVWHLSEWTLASVGGFSGAVARVLQRSLRRSAADTALGGVGRGLLGAVGLPLAGALELVAAASAGTAATVGVSRRARPRRAARPPVGADVHASPAAFARHLGAVYHAHCEAISAGLVCCSSAAAGTSAALAADEDAWEVIGGALAVHRAVLVVTARELLVLADGGTSLVATLPLAGLQLVERFGERSLSARAPAGRCAGLQQAQAAGARRAGGAAMGLRLRDVWKPVVYGLLNIVTASGIVFANKAVMTTFGFKFIYALTLIHTITTLFGMKVFAAFGMFEAKTLPKLSIAPLAGSYVGYIVLNNLNLQMNTVGFYQISKIAVAPAVLLAEAVFFGKRATKRVVASIVLVCIGVGLSTITDTQMGSNMLGWAVGGGAVVSTALYQIWAGTKQKELQAGSMQLLNEYSPIAAGMLAVLVPVFEPVGWGTREPGTLLGFSYTWPAVAAIAISAVLGLLVSLSTFLVIGATSSLTYNVVGHIKTVIILTGGCMFFGDEMPLKKFLGIATAMMGIVWYSQLKLQQAAAATKPISLTPSRPATNGDALGRYSRPQAV
ncbi:hypothetical protein WJX81_002459 [Elliptochloris bilobata]|uniref:Sugar phosphate transporter domain-containing protein n=1 Tax=Elliptochloris bilobata TaxID=381761 RepID=A0AAW1SDJ0_9CHLO